MAADCADCAIKLGFLTSTFCTEIGKITTPRNRLFDWSWIISSRLLPGQSLLQDAMWHGVLGESEHPVCAATRLLSDHDEQAEGERSNHIATTCAHLKPKTSMVTLATTLHTNNTKYC
jgi:hypothetical protein